MNYFCPTIQIFLLNIFFIYIQDKVNKTEREGKYSKDIISNQNSDKPRHRKPSKVNVLIRGQFGKI